MFIASLLTSVQGSGADTPAPTKLLDSALQLFVVVVNWSTVTLTRIQELPRWPSG